MMKIESVSVNNLGETFGFSEAFQCPERWAHLPLTGWEMAADDYILRYLFRNFRPMRHLEFGTWQGDGVLRCVEECDATVWTINLLEGETRSDGEWAYSTIETEHRCAGTPSSERLITDKGVWVRTDSGGMIGRKYLEAGWGKRVCQIFADSREWDTRPYPDGFFDTAFIDGSHAADVVASDTWQAVRLVRPGGVVMWHDFCPVEQVTRACESTRDVVAFIASNIDELRKSFNRLFWAEPSWLLFGIRATSV